MLPDGRSVLFSVVNAGQAQNEVVAVLGRETKKTATLIQGGSAAEYVASGHLVYAASGALRAVRFDLANLKVLGDPIPVVDEVVSAGTGAANYAVSRRRDGEELFYIAPDNTLMSVPVRQALLPSGIGTPVPLFKTRTAPLSAIARQQCLVDRDGERFLVDTRDEASAAPITLILNWKPPGSAPR